jgi:DNA transposition AAA+ family ATPase
MKTNATPEGKAAAGGDVEQAILDAKTAKKKHRTEALAMQLFEVQSEMSLSDSQLGRMLGSNGTYVSRYRTNDFSGDLNAFETAVSLFLDKRLLVGEDENLTKDGYCVGAVFDFLDYLAARGQMGVGYGPAGRGKTRACRLYAADHPTVVYLHLWDWTARKELLIRDIAKAARVTKRAASDSSLSETLVRVFKGAGRMIIIDNAHEMTPSGRRWLADFHDVTGTAIALIGNPEIQDKFAANDQHASRLGRCCDVTAVTDTKATILHSLASYFPEASGDQSVQKAALDVFRAENGGGGRTVKRLLQAARAVFGTKKATAAEAVEMARSQLLTARRAA